MRYSWKGIALMTMISQVRWRVLALLGWLVVAGTWWYLGWCADGGVMLSRIDLGGGDGGLMADLGGGDGGLWLHWAAVGIGGWTSTISSVEAASFTFGAATGPEVELKSTEAHPLELRRGGRLLAFVDARGDWTRVADAGDRPHEAPPGPGQLNAVEGFAGGVVVMGSAVLSALGLLSLRQRRRRQLYRNGQREGIALQGGGESLPNSDGQLGVVRAEA